MKLDAAERSRLRDALGSTDDANVAASLIEAYFDQQQAVKQTTPTAAVATTGTHLADRYLINPTARLIGGVAAFQVRLFSRAPSTVFSLADADQLFAVSRRVVDIDVVAGRREVCVTVTRIGAGDGSSSAVGRRAFVPLPANLRKRRGATIDFAVAGVESVDDQTRILDVYDEVVNVARLVPAIYFWFEPITTTTTLADDASSVTEDATTTTTSVLGYALCFANMPESIGASFYDHLRSHFGRTIVTAVYSVLASATPVFVVHVRSTATPPSAIGAALSAPRVRRLPTTVDVVDANNDEQRPAKKQRVASPVR
jgi:hypothetical protein